MIVNKWSHWEKHGKQSFQSYPNKKRGHLVIQNLDGLRTHYENPNLLYLKDKDSFGSKFKSTRTQHSLTTKKVSSSNEFWMGVKAQGDIKLRLALHEKKMLLSLSPHTLGHNQLQLDTTSSK